MSLLFSGEIISAVEEELKNAHNSVRVISAYCKLNSIKRIAKAVNPNVFDKRIMMRFRKEDLIKGSTDFEVLQFCLYNGWQTYIRFDLHAKTYIVDNSRGIIGSANMTQSGLTGNAKCNIEMATLVNIEKKDVKKIEELFLGAIHVTEPILNELKRQLDSTSLDYKETKNQWDRNIMDLFAPKICTLFSYEFPDKSSYQINEHIQFLDWQYDGNILNAKERLRSSNSYLWLKTILKNKGGEIFFGELSAELHTALVEDPKPYRKDVKTLLKNILVLIEDWGLEEIKIDKPNYSQRIRWERE